MIQRTYAGVALMSASVLLLELALTRLFSATMFYHFAFLAVSIALFGSAAAGVVLYLMQNRIPAATTDRLLVTFSSLFGLSAVLTVVVLINLPLQGDSGLATYLALTIVYCTAAIPFFCGGVVLTLSFSRYGDDASRLYFCDLGGAAAGCLLLIPLLNRLGGVNTVLAAAALGSMSGILFSWSGKKGSLASAILLGLGLVSLVGWNQHRAILELHSFKGVENRDVLFSKWNSLSHITVRGALSSASLALEIDSDAATTIARGGTNPQAEQMKIEDLVYFLRPHGDVLIMGPGGGKEVRKASAAGARSITAVEVNPIIARDVMSSEPFRAFSGNVYGQPGVSLVVDEARSYIRRSSRRYDVIQADMVDTWAATAAGAFSLTENNLYTVEAFEEFANHLSPNGILTMTRWYTDPPDQMLRLVSLVRAMMADLQLTQPGQHIAIIRTRRNHSVWPRSATLLFSRSGFTAEEVHVLERQASAGGFDLTFTPLTRPRNEFTELIEAGDPAAIWRASRADITPTHDNSPFFFNTLRFSDIRGGLQQGAEWRKTNLGTLVLVTLMVVSSVLVLLFIVAPLLLVRRGALLAQGRLRLVLYFACLGAGFIILEVVLIQKFILFLGHPIYALTVVLFSLLCFSGLGSYASGRIPTDRIARDLPWILVGISILCVLSAAVLSPLFYRFVSIALPWRVMLSLTVLAPIGFLMGMPMPLGLRLTSRVNRELIPWAWGVNGATSVTGSILAVTMAMAWGFNQAILLAGAFYLLAMILARASVSKSRAAGQV